MRRGIALVLLLAFSMAPAAACQRSRAPAPTAPPIFEVHERSILELQSAQTEGRVTSRGLVESYLARIRAYDQAGPTLNAIVTLNPNALDDADTLDKERAAQGPRGPLHGIPVLVKDNYDTVDMPTSGGTLGLALLQPKADAFQVRRLRDAGAVILGKTTMQELADGNTNISSYTGQTRNPYDLIRVPGGSSGGTGAAIAASFAAAGMGSDTCGSIRIPAAHQNLVGLRGTRGLSSRTGVMPMSDTQDIAGPMARSVTDLAVMLDATVGADPADAITSESNGRIPKSYRDGLAGATLKGARIGVLRALFGTAPEDEEVAELMREALDVMKAQGAEVVEAVVPGLDDLLRESSVISDGFTADGLPVGLEMLGGTFAEPTLLRYAYAWEQVAKPRHAPFSTPPLVNGAAPAPRSATVAAGTAPDGAVARLTYYPTTGALEYDVTIAGDARVLAFALHRPEGDRPGPIIAHLVARGQRAGHGLVTLRARDREDFGAGRVFLRLYTERLPLGTAPVRVSLR